MKPTVFRHLPVLILAGASLSSLAATENNVPMLRSHSKSITIIDGDHRKKNYWVLMPEKNPDIYYVEIPMKPHSVTFQSDVDSITFFVKYGAEHDFVILLNDEVSCHTRIRATHRKLQPYSLVDSGAGPTGNTIPFRVGNNDKIYIKGRLNGGEELDFQFDLGAGGCVIKKGSEAKANMRFDGTVTLWNSDGRNDVPSSSSNRLQIGNLRWDDVGFAVAGNMTRREDGLLGNTLFQDKVIEIDYDRGVIVVHDALPELGDGYSKHPAILEGVVPFIQGSFTIGGEHREGWFMFDTGADTSKLVSRTASPASKFFGELRAMVWDNLDADRRLTIGEHTFTGFNYTIGKGRRDDDSPGLLGNDVLKRFNVILDNQNGFIYLQPNSLTGDPFRNPERFLARGVVVGGVVLLLLVAGCGWLLKRGRLKRRVNAQSSNMRQAASFDSGASSEVKREE